MDEQGEDVEVERKNEFKADNEDDVFTSFICTMAGEIFAFAVNRHLSAGKPFHLICPSDEGEEAFRLSSSSFQVRKDLNRRSHQLKTQSSLHFG